MGRVVVPVIEGRSSFASMTGTRADGWLWRVGFEVRGAGCDAWVAGCCVVVGGTVLPVGGGGDIRCGLTRSPSVLSDLMAWDRRYGLFEGRRVSSCCFLSASELALVLRAGTSSVLVASKLRDSR